MFFFISKLRFLYKSFFLSFFKENYFLSLEFHIHNDDDDDDDDNHFENRQTDRKSGQVQSKYRDVDMDLDDGG